MGRRMTQIRLKYVHEYRDNKGNLRRYVRRRGFPLVPIPGLPGSSEFMEAYKAAISGAPAPRGPHKAGTVADLITRYYTSSPFVNLSPSSQALYRGVLGKHVEAHGHRMVADLQPDKAEKIITDIGSKRPGMGNLTLKVLATVFKYAIKVRLRRDNPFQLIDRYKLGEHHTWTDAEIAQYEAYWKIGTRERLAFALLLYSAQRVSDAVKLRRSDVMTITQQKTGAELTIPMHPALLRIVKAGPANGINLIGDANGRPILSVSLSRLIGRAAKQAGLPARCKAHGLRKAALRRLAEHSATAKQIGAVSGHKTLREIERYTAKADQTRLAASAIALLPDGE